MKPSALVIAAVCCTLLLAAFLFLRGPGKQEPAAPPAPKELVDVCVLSGGAPEPLCTEPGDPCPRLRNRKTTEKALDESFMLVHVLPEQTFLLEERRDGWIRLRVIDPPWLSDGHEGWLPEALLQCRRAEKDSFPALANP